MYYYAYVHLVAHEISKSKSTKKLKSQSMKAYILQRLSICPNTWNNNIYYNNQGKQAPEKPVLAIGGGRVIWVEYDLGSLPASGSVLGLLIFRSGQVRSVFSQVKSRISSVFELK